MKIRTVVQAVVCISIIIYLKYLPINIFKGEKHGRIMFKNIQLIS